MIEHGDRCPSQAVAEDLLAIIKPDRVVAARPVVTFVGVDGAHVLLSRFSLAAIFARVADGKTSAP